MHGVHLLAESMLLMPWNARTVFSTSDMLIKWPFSCHRPEDGMQIYTIWARTWVNKPLLSTEVGDDGLDTSIDGKFLIDVMQVCLDGVD